MADTAVKVGGWACEIEDTLLVELRWMHSDILKMVRFLLITSQNSRFELDS